MISHHLIASLLLFQFVYLINLVLTNITSTLFVFYSLFDVSKNYFTKRTALLKSVAKNRVYLPVSILMPAYNEELTVINSAKSLLNIDFEEYEVIVINDGSKDNTFKKLQEAFELYPVAAPSELLLKHAAIRQVYRSPHYKNLTVIDKENGGKADALNAGINLSRYPLFCSIDADTILEQDSLLRTSLLFIQDERVIAAGGHIGISNGSSFDKNHKIHLGLPSRFIERIQIIEYARGFLAGRTFWSAINGLLIVSGAFGIFRKDLVVKIGGYRHTIGEDFDLVIRMRRYCYDYKIPHKVSFIPEIMCWTQAPTDSNSLFKQRNRWQRGLIESLFYNKKMILNPRYGITGLITLPYYLFIEIFNPLIAFMGAISILLLYLAGFINQNTILLFFILEFVWGMALNIFALWLIIFIRESYSFKIILRFTLDCMLEPFGYKPVTKMEQLIATFTFLNREWGEIQRHKIEEAPLNPSVSTVVAANKASNK